MEKNKKRAAIASVDWLDDARLSALEILRCYFHKDEVERAKWWAEDFGGSPDAETALLMIQKELLGAQNRAVIYSKWSDEDKQWVGLCDDYPSLTWLADVWGVEAAPNPDEPVEMDDE